MSKKKRKISHWKLVNINRYTVEVDKTAFQELYSLLHEDKSLLP